MVNEKCKESEDEQMKPYPIKETISFKDFEKFDIRVGTITSVSGVTVLAPRFSIYQGAMGSGQAMQSKICLIVLTTGRIWDK